MFETRLKKKKRVCIRTYSRNISHTHTNTPFLYLLWNKLSHLVRGPTFEQEASKQSRKNSATQWYIVVFGCRYSNRAWDLPRCRLCLTLYTFHLKSERWDVSMCHAWNWMHAFFSFWWTWWNVTLCQLLCPSKTLWNLHIFPHWLSSLIWRRKSPVCLLCKRIICRSASICFWYRFKYLFLLLVFPIIAVPIWSFRQRSLSMFDGAKMGVTYAVFLPPSLFPLSSLP